ncbi:hypothetical protein [Rhodoligotrophos ferricapiens]|uniref:hypothetical protein n=1 Tax=Rhodoligotrophos ferricapiens TaxID=3069264 RepID=UPI00315D21E5
MPKLPLAVDIATLVEKKAKSRQALDADASAERLLAKHPEASGISQADVADVLQEEYELAADENRSAAPESGGTTSESIPQD